MNPEIRLDATWLIHAAILGMYDLTSQELDWVRGGVVISYSYTLCGDPICVSNTKIGVCWYKLQSNAYLNLPPPPFFYILLNPTDHTNWKPCFPSNQSVHHFYCNKCHSHWHTFLITNLRWHIPSIIMSLWHLQAHVPECKDSIPL